MTCVRPLPPSRTAGPPKKGPGVPPPPTVPTVDSSLKFDPDPFPDKKVCPDLPYSPGSSGPGTPQQALSLGLLTGDSPNGSATAATPARDSHSRPHGGKNPRRLGPLVLSRSPSSARTAQFLASVVNGIRENERKKVEIELSLHQLRTNDSLASVKDREETIAHLEKTIKELDATNEDLRRQLREAVLLLRRAGDDLEKVGGSLTRKCAAAFVTIQAQHEAIRKLFQAHKAAVEGALIQHLTDSNRVIQDIVDDYRAIVSVPIQDCASTEKKAGTAPTQDP